jgi:hypothetical protein
MAASVADDHSACVCVETSRRRPTASKSYQACCRGAQPRAHFRSGPFRPVIGELRLIGLVPSKSGWANQSPGAVQLSAPLETDSVGSDSMVSAVGRSNRRT